MSIERNPRSGAWYLSQPEVLAAGEPSHTAVSSAADMALLFQALYCTDVWSPESVAEGTRVQVEMPLSGDFGGTGQPTRMELFVLVGSGAGAPAGAPGLTASETTFGHTGAPTQMSFCDPESGISFAFFTNGYPKKGYDRSRGGSNQLSVLGTLAFDCLAR